MSLTDIALELDQGDDEVIDITLSPATAGGSVDLAGCTLLFFIKTSAVDLDADALIAKRSDNVGEIDITDEPNGVANVQIAHIDTSTLANRDLGRKLRWSLQVIDAATDITTLAKGTVVINRDLIQATT